MSLLAELLAETRPIAKVAKVAKVPPAPPENSQVSQLSRRPAILVDTAKVRARLLALAESEFLDAGLVRALPESELFATAEQCAEVEAEEPGCGRELARQHLHMLAITALMREGRLPPGFDTPALCARCGPVWLPASQAALLDKVGGWSRTLGCPWCFVHLPEGMRIPRPHVTCAACQHYQPDSVNSGAGMGRCLAGVPGTTWPHQQRVCKSFQPRGSNND